jgi:hypothetical protein
MKLVLFSDYHVWFELVPVRAIIDAKQLIVVSYFGFSLLRAWDRSCLNAGGNPQNYNT